jgi:apolipoprotein N-acyltransferase
MPGCTRRGRSLGYLRIFGRRHFVARHFWQSRLYTDQLFAGAATGIVFGVWGVTFCVLFFAAAVAALLSGAGTARQRQMSAATAGLLMLVALTFGWWRVHFMPKPEHSVTVGLLASDLSQNVEVADPDENKGRLLRDYLEQVGLLAAQGARVIVLPEKLSAVVDPQITSETDALFQDAATKYKCSIVVGVLRRSGNDRLNEARMYRPAHPAVVIYDKQHMLPPFESNLRPGTTRALVSEPSGMWGVAICKDMDFPLLSRQYGKDGAGLLLVPAWDFGVDAWLHDRMAVMRGVESGFSIARTAKDGLLTVSDSRGQILAQRSSASAPFASVVAAVPVRNIATLYSRFGDWFAWLNIALLGMLLGSRLKRAG